MSVIRATIDGDNQNAVIATKDGIKVLGWEDIKSSELVEMNDSDTAPKGYKAWRNFHAQNPWVLPLLIKEALKLKNSGATKWSIRAIFHHVRREFQLNTKGDTSRFKLNNNYSPYYARLIMKLKPELTGFFDIREVNKNHGATA